LTITSLAHGCFDECDRDSPILGTFVLMTDVQGRLALQAAYSPACDWRFGLQTARSCCLPDALRPLVRSESMGSDSIDLH
jgi:hypothetical protein